MTAEDFARVERAFSDLIGLQADARGRVLEAEWPDRPDLRLELERLLGAHDQLAAAASGNDDDAPPATIAPGAQIGAYRLVEHIGKGGMGEVYRAERADGAFAQQVALKITQSAIARGDTARRFRVERQILASLQHPHIVRLLDGGATADGQAYLVMEYVEGAPITDYCDRQALSLDDRLRLFSGVCGAVQYAHQHAVVHRDLKPANILVAADGTPRVLDFGVAKLLAQQPEEGLATVGVFQAPMTPNYASPEQLQGLPVTTTSDVYALGVLLYEIVCGVRPYDTQRQTLDRVLEIVLHKAPIRPSAVPEAVARPLPYSRRRLRGDIDAIVLKALSKDRDERYQSASELASDIARFLDQQPVLARVPTAAYVLRRFAARNKALVTTTALALLAILATSGIAVWQWQVARHEQALAERRFSEVRQLANRVLFDYQQSLRRIQAASDLRARMAADALKYLDALAAERLSSADLQLEAARGYLAIAVVQGAARNLSLGDREGALSSLGKAERVLQALVERRPDLEAAAIEYAALPCHYVRVEPRNALAHGGRCLDRLTPLAATMPPNALLTQRLGTAHLFLAEAGAVEHAPEAVSHFARLLDTPGFARDARLNLSLARRIAGTGFLNAGDPRRALAEAEEAQDTLAPIIAAEGVTSIRTDQAFTLQLVGRSWLALGDAARAQQDLDRALRLMRDAYDENPRDAFLQDRLLVAYHNLTTALEVSDPRAAASKYREALALIPSLKAPLDSPYRDIARGALYAGAARFGPSPPACDVLELADDHLSAARQQAPLEPMLAQRAQWVRESLGRCSRR